MNLLFADALSSLDLQTDLASPPDIQTAFIKMILTLVALVFLLFLTYWVLRKTIHNRWQKGVGSQQIRIVEKRVLSPKTMLYLVEVDGKKVLLAESHLEVKRLESFEPRKTNGSPEL